MSRTVCRWPRACTGVTIVTLLSLPAAAVGGQWTLIDNFDDGNDDGWAHHDLLVGTPWGPTIYDASSFEYLISSTTSIPVQQDFMYTGAYWGESASNPYYSEGFLRTTIRADGPGGHCSTAMRWDFETISGYVFAADHVNDSILIVRIDGGVMSFSASGNFPLDVGKTYILEGGAVGSHLSLKIWAHGDPIPQDPQLTAVDSTYRVGTLGLYVYNLPEQSGGRPGRLSGHFDNVYYIPEPMSLAMLTLGGLALARHCRGRPRTSRKLRPS